MTSTNINQGMDVDARPSSKVLRPPGGGSSDIFGTGAPAAPSPARARAPPSNNIFGGYDDSSSAQPKHNRLKSNVFGADPEPSPGSARKNSKTYESNVFAGGAKPAEQNPDEEDKEKDDNEENENNNDAKTAEPVKSKGDGVYNPITGELNIGQSETKSRTQVGLGKARGQFNRDRDMTYLNIGAEEELILPQSEQGDNGSGQQLSPQKAASTRRLSSDVSNPITGETKTFAIGPNITKELGKA